MPFEKNNAAPGNRGPKFVGIALAGALAAGAPTDAQDTARGNYNAGGEYVSSNELSAPSQEVMNVLSSLDKEIGDSLSITQKQIAQIHRLVDDFAAKHPAYEGTTRTEGDQIYSSASYSPYVELQDALMRGRNANPFVMGIMLAYIKDQTLKQGEIIEK